MFTQQRPTAKVSVGPAAPCRALGHVAAENLGKTDPVLASPGDKRAPLTLSLDQGAAIASHALRGDVASTGGLKG